MLPDVVNIVRYCAPHAGVLIRFSTNIPMNPLMILAETPSLPDPTKLIDFLKYGQFGAALAMLILGFYLHWQASRSETQIEQRQNVARQFMNYAIAFFVMCALGEILNSVLPKLNRPVTATFFVPPLDEKNSSEYGDIQIVRNYRTAKDRKPALSEGQSFEVYDGTTFNISLQPMADKLAAGKEKRQSLENTLAKETPDLGGRPK
jgi:hypothetical protein